MIKNENLLESQLLPKIILARHFETKDSPIRKTTKRTADYYELSIYLASTGSLTINNATHKLRYGDVRFVKPGSTVYSITPFRCYTINFHFGEVGVYYQNEILDAIPDYFHTSGEQIAVFEQIIKYFNSGSREGVLMQNSLLMQLLATFFQYFCSESNFSPVVLKCISYIKNNFNHQVTLENLGELTGYSPLHLLRLFKANTAKTPHEFLTDVRILHAKELLLNTDMPIYDITTACGFRSDSHFKTLFKKLSGINPGAYRKISETIGTAQHDS